MFPQTTAETAAGSIPFDQSYPPGHVRRYHNTALTNYGPAFQAAVNQRLQGGDSVVFAPGTYLVTSQVTADGFDGLEIFGYGASVDFQVSSPLKLGNHSINGSLQYTQLTPTCRNIVIAGLKFRPSANGWNGDRFAYLNPIDLSAVANVHIHDCRFEDWDFAAINISAPSRQVLVEHCYFSESQEGDVCYGVRPFAHVPGASTDNYNEANGTLAYPMPTSYHEGIIVRDCYFYQCSHAILSWNVHGSSYVNNVFEKPTIRTVSVTAWNFDVLVQGNKHIIANNAAEVVSTAIAVGIGSQRVQIKDEHFYGALSGTSVNNSMKLIDIAGVNIAITVEGCDMNVSGCASLIVIGPNVEATIRNNKFQQKAAGVTASIVLNDQTASPVALPGFNQPRVRILGNVDILSSRFVELSGAPPGGVNSAAIMIMDNVLETALSNGFVVTNTSTAGWRVRARGNQFTTGAATYSVDFGSAKVVFEQADSVELEFKLQSTGLAGAGTAPLTRALPAIADIFNLVLPLWQVYGGGENSQPIGQFTFTPTTLSRTQFAGTIARSAGAASFQAGIVAVKVIYAPSHF